MKNDINEFNEPFSYLYEPPAQKTLMQRIPKWLFWVAALAVGRALYTLF